MNDYEAYKKFEDMCKAYLDADDEHRKAALDLLNEQERKALLCGVAVYRLMTESDRYEAVKNAMATEIYNELRR